MLIFSVNNNFLVIAAFAACIVIFVFPLFLLETSITFLIFSGILLVLSIIYFVSEKRGQKKIIVSSIIFVLCCGLGYSDSFAFWENNLTYENLFTIICRSMRTRRGVAMSTNVLFGVQSVYMKQDGLTGMEVIDELIKDEVSYYKDIYEEKGIKGLIDSL